MLIVGAIENKEEAYAISRIAKFSMVGERFRYLGSLAREQKKEGKK